ncbi:hypothetical protein KEM48_000665 [Puccinia striiformis f. sp. tritici PST-130]|nr:hypothetical protein KEM48_000665 [Puccinia striiformis f. sp. tritici PST-130]
MPGHADMNRRTELTSEFAREFCRPLGGTGSASQRSSTGEPIDLSSSSFYPSCLLMLGIIGLNQDGEKLADPQPINQDQGDIIGKRNGHWTKSPSGAESLALIARPLRRGAALALSQAREVKALVQQISANLLWTSVSIFGIILLNLRYTIAAFWNAGRMLASQISQSIRGERLEKLKYEYVKTRSDRRKAEHKLRAQESPSSALHLSHKNSPPMKSTCHQAHLKRLHSSLLPLLGEQIAGLGSLIDSTALGEDSERQFEYILGIQSELHRTLVDIASVLTTICPETSSRKQSINDQHLEALKFIRLDRLRTRADRMRCTIEDFLDACCQNRMDARKSWAIAEIESTIIFIRGSELNFAQMEWQFESPVNIDDLLSKATSRINLLNNKMNQTPTFRTLQTRNGPVIQLTKSTIAIVKLSRLFYKKLSGTAFSIKRCPLYTKMCSSELDTMISSATALNNTRKQEKEPGTKQKRIALLPPHEQQIIRERDEEKERVQLQRQLDARQRKQQIEQEKAERKRAYLERLQERPETQLEAQQRKDLEKAERQRIHLEKQQRHRLEKEQREKDKAQRRQFYQERQRQQQLEAQQRKEQQKIERQREKDIGKAKVDVAARFIMDRVPQVKVTPHHCKIQDKDDEFYMMFNMVLCGLDSVEARRWINATMVNLVDPEKPESVKPLIGGGTEGFKGQSRVILPTITSCYECSLDLVAPQTVYPLNTIVNTPRSPEHCIEWLVD